MELTNEFTVPVPVEQAWLLLTDVERIAPCLPGAELQAVEGDDYRGIVKVKVGPMTAQYRGTASFVEKDVTGRRAVLQADGRDSRGQGTASATVTAQLRPDGGATKVTIVTELRLTGKVAQFGRGVLADVSTKLLGQFVDRLQQDVLNAPTATSTADPGTRDEAGDAPAASRRIDGPEAAPVDLLQTAGSPLARRLVPLVGVLLALVLVAYRQRHRRR